MATTGCAKSSRAPPAASDFFRSAVEQIRPEDVCVMLYTSEPPQAKGVCHTHAGFIARHARRGVRRVHARRRSAFLPADGVGGDHLFSYAQAMVAASPSTARNRPNRDERPARNRSDVLFRAAPVFENLLTTVMIRIDDAGRINTTCSTTSWRSARCGAEIMDGKPVSPSTGCCIGSAIC